jgi:hypothetical protein
VSATRPGWLGAYRGQARERMRNGKLERLCRQCGGWREIKKFAACSTGTRGKRCVCHQCLYASRVGAS